MSRRSKDRERSEMGSSASDSSVGSKNWLSALTERYDSVNRRTGSIFLKIVSLSSNYTPCPRTTHGTTIIGPPDLLAFRAGPLGAKLCNAKNVFCKPCIPQPAPQFDATNAFLFLATREAATSVCDACTKRSATPIHSSTVWGG